jgi:hypothetical protein
MNTKIALTKEISKMTKLEVMRLIEKIAPTKYYLPKTTQGGRAVAQKLYEQYLAS